MRKRNLRIGMGLILAIVVIMSFSNMSFATQAKDNFDFEQFDSYKNDKAKKATENAMGTAINTIRIVGTGTAVIMITYLGIKYMMAAPSEKADFKKSASIYILGAVLIFAASNILALIINFTDQNISKAGAVGSIIKLYLG